MSTLNAKLNMPAHGLLTKYDNTPAEKNRQYMREVLMERIRSRVSQYRSFAELAKAMRMSMLDKRYALDAVEKSNLQKSLDSMQHCIKVTSRQGLVERLECLSRQLGLKFMEDPSGLFISSDMFFVEILLDAKGELADVKVHHECKIEQQSCSELVTCLKRCDFADFTVQLEGLSSIYQLNAEPKVKSKAFVALQAVETDLYNMYHIQNFSRDINRVLSESTVGVVLKRRGGHPMKLTYFVSPYDLICLPENSMVPLSLDMLAIKDIGLSVTVNLEPSSANKLEIFPTVTFSKNPQTGVQIPVYAPLTQINSTLMPATFVLRLNQSLPVCHVSLLSLGVPPGSITDSGISTGMETQHKPTVVSGVMDLVVEIASQQKIKNWQKGLFVNLPDQNHCYFFMENKKLKASLVSFLPFTEPSQVLKILEFLKRQALFYTLLSSCVRPNSKIVCDMDITTIIEVNIVSFEKITVSLQHSYEESMSTLEFNLGDNKVSCVLYGKSDNYDHLSTKLTEVVQKCMSIPVTIRALLNLWDHFHMLLYQCGIGDGNRTPLDSIVTGSAGNSFGNFDLVMGSNNSNEDYGGNNAGQGLAAKIESGEQQRSSDGANAVESVAFLKYQHDVKMEDFRESPKSIAQVPALQSDEASSLGHSQPQSLFHAPNHLLQREMGKEEEQQFVKTTAELADKYKNIWKEKTSLKSSLSITHICTESKTLQQNVDVKRSGGIEIIPLTTEMAGSNGNSVTTYTSPSASSTITITPINVPKDNKYSGTPSMNVSLSPGEDKTPEETGISEVQREKKRKKKRDDSPMGPPEKIFPRQNSPAIMGDTVTGVGSRKFSSPSSSAKSSCGGLLSTGGLSLPIRPSPKSSPVYSSPKHNTASNSPKSPFGTHSPKHGSSGKPCMSTLKTAAATSLSPKSDKSNNSTGMPSCSGTAPATSARSLPNSGGTSTSTEGNISSISTSAGKSREKDKLTPSSPTSISASACTAALSAIKASLGATAMQLLKPVSLSQLPSSGNLGSFGNSTSVIAAASSSMGAVDSNCVTLKGTAGAVSLMTTTTAIAVTTATPHQQQQFQPPHVSSDFLGGASMSSEYMVKTSQEGLKLTINKTSGQSSVNRTKDGFSATSLSFAKKTGLKPGVNSGPASKKSPSTASDIDAVSKLPGASSFLSVPTASSLLSSTSPQKNVSQGIKHIFQKSNSSGNLTAKLTAASCSTSSTSLSKTSNISFFPDMSYAMHKVNTTTDKKLSEFELSTSVAAGLSPSASQLAGRLDHHVDMLKILQYASPSMAASMEGFMKGLNTKFQIPKLSQRMSNIATSVATIAPVAPTYQSISAPTTPTSVSPPSTLFGNCASAVTLKTPITLTHQQHAVTNELPFMDEKQQEPEKIQFPLLPQLKVRENHVLGADIGCLIGSSPSPPYQASFSCGNIETSHRTSTTTSSSAVAIQMRQSPPTSNSVNVDVVASNMMSEKQQHSQLMQL